MKIHHLRNATLVVEVGNTVILVDPMLGKIEESGPTFTLLMGNVMGYFINISWRKVNLLKCGYYLY